MAAEYKQHPRNVPGAFYVVDDCCTACGVPEALAPDLFDWDERNHCFVKHQPVGADEIDAMLRVVATQELGCIRYRGHETPILTRLVEMGEGEQCDGDLPPGVTPFLRNHATFRSCNVATAWSAEVLLERLSRYLQAHANAFKTTPIEVRGNRAMLSVSWFEDRFHEIHCRTLEDGRRCLVHHFGPRGLSHTLHDWLSTDPWVEDLRWQTEAQCDAEGPWHHAPW